MQLSLYPERLMLPLPKEEILSGCEDIVSSCTDLYTTCRKTDPETILVRHMVDIKNAVAQFREASERRQDTAYQAHHGGKSLPNRLFMQKRLSIYNWNPGPRRGKEGAIEKRIAGRWHIITLQEASEYIDHMSLTSQFHVTHFGRCTQLTDKADGNDEDRRDPGRK